VSNSVGGVIDRGVWARVDGLNGNGLARVDQLDLDATGLLDSPMRPIDVRHANGHAAEPAGESTQREAQSTFHVASDVFGRTRAPDLDMNVHFNPRRRSAPNPGLEQRPEACPQSHVPAPRPLIEISPVQHRPVLIGLSPCPLS